jgi:hypothetical protein
LRGALKSRLNAAGRPEFVGEAFIGHIPADEKAAFAVGRAFAVVAEQKCLSTKERDKETTEYEEELHVRCRRAEAADVRLCLTYSGQYSLAAPPKNAKEISKDAVTWQGDLTVPPGDEGVKCRFTVRKTVETEKR